MNFFWMIHFPLIYLELSFSLIVSSLLIPMKHDLIIFTQYDWIAYPTILILFQIHLEAIASNQIISYIINAF